MGLMSPAEPYYRPDLALVHHEGFGFHADRCAPGILAVLEPVRARGGLVLEIGCGSGRLTRHLLDAGHRVVATDASEAMLDLARRTAPDAVDIHRLTLPDDPVPAADAIVSVGHALSYLDDVPAVERALGALALALRPGGVLALDLCDLRWAEAHQDGRVVAQVSDNWAIISRAHVPDPDHYVREMTTFVRVGDGWRRDDERHVNVLLDTSRVPALLMAHGIDAVVGRSFGAESLPDGLFTVIGRRPAEG